MESLNNHAKTIGSNMHIIHMSGQSNVQGSPTKCAKCDNKSTHFANEFGDEKYLCDLHAKKFMFKNGELPNDLWFCKKL